MSATPVAMRERLLSLRACGDAASLQSAVSELCGEFGRVTHLEILTLAAEAEKRRALCLLRLETEAQEIRLMSSLGVSRFGDDVLVIVDFPVEARSSVL
jgi:hypothetical protein